HALKDLAAARHDSQAAIASDQALLTSVKGDLKTALAKAEQERQAKEAAKERALAPPPGSIHQPPPPPLNLPPAKPGSYANPVLGTVYEGPSGIEVGWGDPNAIGNTMARTYGQYHGGNSTAFGANFSQLLQSLGGPGGILQNSPPTGSLPGNWPQW